MTDEYDEDSDQYVLDDNADAAAEYQTDVDTDIGYMDRVKQTVYDHGAEGGGAVIGGLGGAAAAPELAIPLAVAGGAAGYLGKKAAEYHSKKSEE